MKLIIFSGLPGTGKSTIAEAVGRELKIPVFAKDWLEATIIRSGLIQNNEEKSLGITGYELLTTLATRQLSLAQSVILDSVATTESIRNTWHKLASRFSAEKLIVECICSDIKLHKQRLQERQRGIPNWYELKWEQVEKVRSDFVSWNETRLTLDSVEPFEKNLSLAIEYCSK